MMRLGSMKSCLMALAIIGLIGSASTARSANLNDPAPSLWGCELSQEEVMQGITAGLIGRGWSIIDNDGEGHLVAQVIVRGKHFLTVDLTYDDQSFDIDYKESANLEYRLKRNGRAKIHRNANSWMNNIRQDITVQLSALCALNR